MVGNLSNFTKIDVLRCLLKIEKPVSRSRLSSVLDLGEGTVRSLLDILKSNDLLTSNKEGHFLNKKGQEITNKIKDKINMEQVELKDTLQNRKNIAVHIKHIKNKNIGKAYELRDIALKNGADGALILEYDKGLKLYGLEDSDNDVHFQEIEHKFELRLGDIVVITYAASYKLAEHGVLAVVIEICDGIKNTIEKLK
tara:strand:+ start:422 stop:1012 length:591 start_codon:yes stop_codon:yes gene_type:complete